MDLAGESSEGKGESLSGSDEVKVEDVENGWLKVESKPSPAKERKKKSKKKKSEEAEKIANEKDESSERSEIVMVEREEGIEEKIPPSPEERLSPLLDGNGTFVCQVTVNFQMAKCNVFYAAVFSASTIINSHVTFQYSC